VSCEFHDGFSATTNHCSEHTLIFVHDRRCWFSMVDMPHRIVTELWTRLLILRKQGQFEEAQANGGKDEHLHNASFSIPRCLQQELSSTGCVAGEKLQTSLREAMTLHWLRIKLRTRA